MSKITRQIAKLFGSTASAGQIAKFGSLAASAPVTYSGATATPTLVQSLGNWQTGWFAGVEGANSPAIEDLNAYCYATSYQVAYQMQTGVPEWDATTTYYTGSMVSANSQIYVSLIDSNLNNAVSVAADWQAVSSPPAVLSYTPTVTPNAGVFTPTSSGFSGIYQKNGNVVTVKLSFIFIQSGATTNSFTISLPFASSGLTPIAPGGDTIVTAIGTTGAASGHYFIVTTNVGIGLATLLINGGTSAAFSFNGNGSSGLSDYTNGTWAVSCTITYLSA